MGFIVLTPYNLALWLLVFTWPIWIAYLALIPKARAGFRQKIGWYSDAFKKRVAQHREGKRKTLWFHAVSVGEFNAIRPLIDGLRETHPELNLVISTTTLTSQRLAKEKCPDLTVFYFPYDLRFAVKRAIKLIQPDLIIITETELWPNFIDLATRRFDKPVILVNGRISKKSFEGYQWVSWLIGHTLSQMTHLYVQSSGDAQRIKQLGNLPDTQLTVTGNLKFDLNPIIDPIQKSTLAHLLNFSSKDAVLTLASTHPGEEDPLIDLYLKLQENFPELKLILAPRHPERRDEIKKLLNAKGVRFSLRSQLTHDNPNQQPVVVLDSIGELTTVYSISGDNASGVAIMGGSFVEKGGQNPLEPISQKVPVVYGPHMFNFSVISRLITDNKAGYQVTDTAELGLALSELITQPEIYQNIVEKGQELIESNRGAKPMLMAALERYLV